MKSAPFWVTLFITGWFAVFFSFAWGRVVTHWAPQTGYTASERAAHHRLLSDGAAREVVPWKARPHAVLVQRQAEAYATVYGLTVDNMNAYQRWGF